MSVVREVERRRRYIDEAFARAKTSGPDTAAVQADYARYLCVLLSGYVEKSIAELAVEYARDKTAAPLRSYLENSFSRLANVDKDRLLQVMGSFDATWREKVDAYVVDARQAALNSVVGLRNNIAHGGGGTVTLIQMERYWVHIVEIVDFVESLFFPTPPVLRPKAARKRR